MSEQNWGVNRPDAGMWWAPQVAEQQNFQHNMHMGQQLQQEVVMSTASQSQHLFSYKMASSFENQSSNVSNSSPVGAAGIREYDYRAGGGNPTMNMPASGAQWWYPPSSMDNMHSQNASQTMAPVPPTSQTDSQNAQEAVARQQQEAVQRHQQHLDQRQQEALQRHQQEVIHRHQQEAIQRHHQEQQRQAEHALQQHIEAQQRHLNNHYQQPVLQQHQQIQPHIQTKGRMPRSKADARPRGRMTAYAFFVQTCREEHKKKHPEENVVFAEFSRKCADRWKTMSDKEKKRFHEMAETDKKRYDTEMQNYTPPKGEKQVRGKKRKQIKDPNAPKRSLSAFFWFSNDERGKVKAQNPEYGVGDIAKELGRRWADATQETKKKFEDLADKDKARYEKEMTAYKKRNNAVFQQQQQQQVVQQQQQQMIVPEMAEDDDDDEVDEEDDD